MAYISHHLVCLRSQIVTSNFQTHLWSVWKKVYNPHFNYGEFAIIKSQSGLNSFKISVGDFVEK